MGRPINPRKIGSGSGKIQVTSYRLVGGTETTTSQDSLAFIISQRSLVNKAAGALGEGEFRISVVNPNDSTTDNASKLCNRTVVVGGIGSSASAPQKFKYTVSDTGPSTPQPGAAIGDEAFDATSVDTLGVASVDSQ